MVDISQLFDSGIDQVEKFGEAIAPITRGREAELDEAVLGTLEDVAMKMEIGPYAPAEVKAEAVPPTDVPEPEPAETESSIAVDLDKAHEVRAKQIHITQALNAVNKAHAEVKEIDRHIQDLKDRSHV